MADDGARTQAAGVVRVRRGPAISCKGWPQEAALRMLPNSLDPEVAEHPEEPDGTPLAAEKLARVLSNDPATGVMRHVDAGYVEAEAVAQRLGVRVPMAQA